MSEKTLDQLPQLKSVYASAAGGALKRRPHHVEPDSIPETSLLVEGVGLDRVTVAAVNRHLGAPIRDAVPSIVVHGTAFPLMLELLRQPDFPLPLLGLIHLKNQVQHRRRITPGERVSIHVSAGSLRSHHSGVTFEVTTDISDGSGGKIWHGVSTFLAKGIGVTGHQRPTKPERPEFTAPVPTAQWTFAKGEGRRWAAVLGDYNPIHLSTITAKALGLPREIVHGTDLAARALAGLEPAEGGYSWEMEFGAPVHIPARIGFSQDSAGDSTEFVGFRSGPSPRVHFTGSLTPLA